MLYHRRDKNTGIPTEQTEDYRRKREQQLAEARGALLILSPWGLDDETAPTDYARFHRLNELAAEICSTTDVALLNMSEIVIN